MVKETRFQKSFKSSNKKKFPVLVGKTKVRKELGKFNWGMNLEDYQKLMSKVYTWTQADYSGEISLEIQTRKASELSQNRFLTPAQLTLQIGPRGPDVTVRTYERLVEDAQKIYHRKRENYIENVKKFIGNFLKEFVSPDFISSLKAESDYFQRINVATSAAEFIEWFERILFKLLRWDSTSQVTELLSLILNKATISGNGNSGVKYLASIDLLIEKVKRTKVNILVDKYVIANNIQPDNLIKSSYETSVDNEVDSDGLIIQRIYNECKDHGISKEIRQSWIQKERSRHLRDREAPYTSLRIAMSEIRKDLDYMMSIGQTNKSEGFSISINATELEDKDKCRKCVEEKGSNRVNHKWYDCYQNPKSRNYRESSKSDSKTKSNKEISKTDHKRKEGKERTIKISVTEYNKYLAAKGDKSDNKGMETKLEDSGSPSDASGSEEGNSSNSE
jgi:hypothetical protein